MEPNLLDNDAWVPPACTLPTKEQPLRLAEFDAFFTNDVLAVDRPTSGRLTISVRPEAATAARAAELAVKESGCCSFFSFDLTMSAGKIILSVSTEPAHGDVLAALGDRVERVLREAAR